MKNYSNIWCQYFKYIIIIILQCLFCCAKCTLFPHKIWSTATSKNNFLRKICDCFLNYSLGKIFLFIAEAIKTSLFRELGDSTVILKQSPILQNSGQAVRKISVDKACTMWLDLNCFRAPTNSNFGCPLMLKLM